MTNEELWNDARIANDQRENADASLQRPIDMWPSGWRRFAKMIADLKCPGDILEIGCASGYAREFLDRAGVPYKAYTGYDISTTAIEIAKERYPESSWVVEDSTKWGRRRADIVIDGCSLMHREHWQEALTAMANATRRWLVLCRVPLNVGGETVRIHTEGYGKQFPAWRFNIEDLVKVAGDAGLVLVEVVKDHENLLCFARPRHYATYCDSNYWPRAKVMIETLAEHAWPCVVHVLAYDQEAHDVAMANTTSASVIAYHAPAVKRWPDRTPVEQMWSYGPQFIASLMEAGEPITYVDADIMFFSSPEPLFAEWGGTGCAVVPHAFPVNPPRGIRESTHLQFGEFNVGIVHFGSIDIARKWASMCDAWCYDRLEDGKYGDQKYLESIATMATEYPGACVGPWGIHGKALEERDSRVYFGGKPLISYHYSALRIDGNRVQPTRPEYELTPRQLRILYDRYIRRLVGKGIEVTP